MLKEGVSVRKGRHTIYPSLLEVLTLGVRSCVRSHQELATCLRAHTTAACRPYPAASTGRRQRSGAEVPFSLSSVPTSAAAPVAAAENTISSSAAAPVVAAADVTVG